MYELSSGEEGVVSDLKMMIEVGITKHNNLYLQFDEFFPSNLLMS